MVGQTVSHYRILERLGAGAMGVVYRAEDTRLDRPVALKFLPEEFTRDPLAVERLHREAKAASSLHHQNIRTIFAFDECEGRQFIVMELLEGQALDHVIGARPVTLPTLISVALQIADALDVAHARGIVHRDIKPANMFVTRAGIVKVLDFGLAKTLDIVPTGQASGDRQPTVLQLTVSGTSVGTAGYMSPEQVRGEPADARSDLFAFGSVLYEMATGRLAFCGQTLGVIFDAVLNRTPVPPRVLVPELPASLEALILKAIAKSPGERYQSAAELREDLRRIQHEVGSGVHVPVSAAGSAADLAAPARFPAPAATPSSAQPAVAAPARVAVRYRAAMLGLAAVVVVAALVRWGAAGSTYYPCVVVGDVRSSSEDVHPAMLQLAMRRALGQLPDLAVFDQHEYDLARKRDAASAQAATNEAGLERWLPAWPRHDPVGPAVAVSAEVRPSLGEHVVTVSITTRGRFERVDMPYRGIDQLFMRGVDDIAKLTITRYREDQHDGAGAALKDYRPVMGLLSEHIDALKCYVTGLEKWAHLEMTPAERELTKAVEIDPQFALAHLLLAEVRVFQNQWSAARGEIAIAQRRPEALTAADHLRIRALLARASGNAPEERKYLLRLSGLEPFRKDYVYELAESYFHTAEVDAAQENYLKALRLDDRYALAHNHLGYCYTWKGQHDLAIGEFNRYLELDSTANAYDSLGDAYFHRGDYARAADAKRKVLEMDSGLYFARRSLAAIEILAGRHGSAQRILEDALTGTPDPVERARFHASLAFLHQRAGRLDQAIDACTAGLALMEAGRSDAPGDELLWLLGQIELARGRLPAARSALAQMRKVIDEHSISATNFKPIFKYWLHLAALIETREGRGGDAIGRLDELGQIRQKLGYWSTPYDQAYFLDASGRLREANGQTDGAERDYRDALAYNGHFALARFDLARLLGKNGQHGDARREMASFLDLWATADQAAPELRQAREFMRKAAAPE